MNPRSRLRLLLSGGVVPLDPNALAGNILWLDARITTVSKNTHEQPIGTPDEGNDIDCIIQPGDSYGGTPAHIYAEQTRSAWPTLHIDSNGRRWLSCANDVSMTLQSGGSPVGITLNSDFVLWAVVNVSSSGTQTIYLLSNESAGFADLILPAGTRPTLVDDTTTNCSTDSAALPDADTLYLLRVRRAGSNAYIAWSGQYEVPITPTPTTMTPDTILGDPNGSNWSNIGSLVGSILISTDAGVAANPPAGIDAAGGYFDKGFGGSVPWGVHL